MRARKMLGSVVIGHINHSIVKLENNHYAVGQVKIGQVVEADDQFETLDAAFERWIMMLGAQIVRQNIVNGCHD